MGPEMAALVVANFLSWGHWPVCAKLARAPVQPFGIVMVLAQTLTAWTACCLHGTAFFEAFVQESAHVTAIISVIFGGAAIAIGDFSAAAAIERLGVAVGGPVCFSCMLVCGSIGDYLIDGSGKPGLLFGGIAGCIGAVVADSQSHASPQSQGRLQAVGDQVSLAQNDSAKATAEFSVPQVLPTTPAQVAIEMEVVAGERPSSQAATSTRASLSAPTRARSQFQLGMTVAIIGGCLGGMWTVLSTLASYLHALNPLVLLFYFHLGEVLFIVPVVMLYGRLFDGATSACELFRQTTALTCRQALWTCAAGTCIAVGYLCYFATKEGVPRPVMFAFGCAAGATGMVWGLGLR